MYVCIENMCICIYHAYHSKSQCQHIGHMLNLHVMGLIQQMMPSTTLGGEALCHQRSFPYCKHSRIIAAFAVPSRMHVHIAVCGYKVFECACLGPSISLLRTFSPLVVPLSILPRGPRW